MKFDEIKNEIVNISKKNDVNHLYLFGSYAKGLQTKNSDIDIVIDGCKDYDKFLDDIDNIMTLTKIDVIDLKKITNNKYLMEDFNTYAKQIY